MEDTERKLGDVINRPYFRLAFIVICLVLLTFVAIKEGFSLWLLSKLHLSASERLESGAQAQINAFYPSVGANLSAGAQAQLNRFTNAYNA
jgi:hypothetical protein